MRQVRLSGRFFLLFLAPCETYILVTTWTPADSILSWAADCQLCVYAHQTGLHAIIREEGGGVVGVRAFEVRG